MIQTLEEQLGATTCLIAGKKFTPMITLEQLILNGSLTLLTYLQYTHLENESLDVDAIVAALCEMLNQLEATFPGAAKDYGWMQVVPWS